MVPGPLGCLALVTQRYAPNSEPLCACANHTNALSMPSKPQEHLHSPNSQTLPAAGDTTYTSLTIRLRAWHGGISPAHPGGISTCTDYTKYSLVVTQSCPRQHPAPSHMANLAWLDGTASVTAYHRHCLPPLSWGSRIRVSVKHGGSAVQVPANEHSRPCRPHPVGELFPTTGDTQLKQVCSAWPGARERPHLSTQEYQRYTILLGGLVTTQCVWLL
jgi:hypothetical protein